MAMITSPLTGSTDILLLRTLDAQDLIRDWESSFKIDIRSELKGHEAIFLYECNQTGLQFFFPFDVYASRSLYTSLQENDWYYMPERWEYHVALKDLAHSKAILEIGSGSGSFLDHALRGGLSITGIDANDAAVKTAQSKGLPVANTDLTSLSEELVETYDAVCAFQVLEHLPDPKEFITSALKLLRAQGKLVLSVPNSSSFLRYQFNLLDMPPHHMTRWCKKTFRALETLFPLKLERLLLEPLPVYQTQAYLEAYSRYFLSSSVLMKLLFNRFTLPIFSAVLKTNLKNLLTGQTLYAQFRKCQ